MMVSTKGRYALRPMVDIAQQGAGAVVPLKDVSARQAISLKYLESIALQLSKAGFLNSTRGPRGGYSLTRPPQEYTVGSILYLAEGPMVPVSCLADPEQQCTRIDTCTTICFWKGLNKLMDDYFNRYTLADLLQAPCKVIRNRIVPQEDAPAPSSEADPPQE